MCRASARCGRKRSRSTVRLGLRRLIRVKSRRGDPAAKVFVVAEADAAKGVGGRRKCSKTPTCRTHYPGGSGACACRLLPRSRGLTKWQEHPRTQQLETFAWKHHWP